MESYDPQKIERKWQKIWEKQKLFKARDEIKRPKFYCLDMFPYSSAHGLHVGHLKGYTFSDVIAKKRIMERFNCLHPMGFDAFGLPAENYAIKTGIHPAVLIKKSIKNIKRQLILAGFGYDWQREITTSDPEYYKWTQWIFLQFFKKGLCYRKEAPVNFCPSCKTVLAREQVIDGKCERCGTSVEKRYLKQWFLKITAYANRLLKDLNKLEWPERVKIMQENWIGRSEGTEIKFPISEGQGVGDVQSPINVFTTRTDTLFGCTYVVIAPEHPIIEELKSEIKNFPEAKKYIEKAKRKSEIERQALEKEKTGVELKGIKAVNPVNNKEIPIFVADYVLMEYGTGAIMAVPAHDQRDFLFAKRYNLPVQEVIVPPNLGKSEKTKPQETINQAFEEDGILINSGPFSGLKSDWARDEITKYLKQRGFGKKAEYFKLRDWLISRQRYWGVPIPIIHCPKCGEVPVPEKDLPVRLPKIKDFKPTGQGQSPLAKIERFVNTKCPICSSRAYRETDTMDTFACSSWYFLRYSDSKNKKEPFSKFRIKNWLPVDLYIGGAEHAVLHLLYARFFTKALKDLKYLDFDEPFLKLFCQGTIYYKGAKMSKSKGNIINPDDLVKKYGADTMRLYELFMGPANQATEWSAKGVIGCYRFLQKVWRLSEKSKIQNSNSKLEKLIHKTIKKVSNDIENFRFNTAISALMILTSKFEKQEKISKKELEILLLLLAPMAPHIAEELWRKSGPASKHKKSIFLEKWPGYDEKLIKEKRFQLIIQVNGRIRDKIEADVDISEEQAKELTLKRERVKRWIEDKEIKKVIFVPGKLINIVV